MTKSLMSPIMKEKRILHLLGSGRGFKMARSLAENGYEVYSLALEDPEIFKEYWSHKNIHLKKKFPKIYEKLKGTKIGIFKFHFIFYPFFIKDVADICIKNKISLIHAHRHFGAWIALIAKKIYNLETKILFDYHDPLEIEDKNTPIIKLFKKSEKWMCENSDFILTQGHEHDDLLIKRWKIKKSKVAHIANPVNIQIFNPKRKSRKFMENLGVGKNEKTILFLGSLVYLFGIDNLIKAAKNILKKCPDTKFLIKGVIRNKNYYENLKKQINDNNLEDKFIWLPFYLSHKEIATLIASSDIGVILHLEGYLITETAIPQKIFEYMSSGIPVVTNNLSNLTRFVKHNYSGIVCDTSNIPELEKNLIKLLKDKKLREKMGENGRKSCETKYNWDIETKKLLKIYDRVLNKA